MTIYIHGFGSSGLGGKAVEFREYFKSIDEPFIAPSLSYVPELAMGTLEELIASCDEVTLIGSSLGGYYSIYLANKYNLKCTLINPAVESAKTLKRAVDLTGLAKNFYDDSSFSWNASHVDMLGKYVVGDVEQGKYLLLLQKADDVLDYREALEKVPDARLILEENGTHSFEDIERHFETIRTFLLGA